MDKQKIRFLAGTFMVALPDFASSVIITASVLWLFSREVSALPFIVGGISAILPDLDIAILLLRGRKIAFAHRLLFHKPIFVIPIWLAIATVSPMYATITAVCILAHFVDDCIGNSQEWGVQLFWPVSSKTFVFFTKREGVWKVVRSYVPDAYEEVSHASALDNYYLRFGPKTAFTLIWTTLAITIAAQVLIMVAS